MKRFYKAVTVEAEADGFLVRLDGRELRSPAKNRMILSSRALAEAIAAEWDGQEEQIAPSAMPMMSFASTAVDRVTPQRAAVIDEIAGYADSDLLCHRADEPRDLVDRQEVTWQPLLDWCAERHGARLQVTAGIMPLRQSPESLSAIHRAVAAADDFCLAALHMLTSVHGSVVIALAVLECHLTPEEAFAASQLDEDFQIERWGSDEEAAERRENLRADAAQAARFLELHRSD